LFDADNTLYGIFVAMVVEDEPLIGNVPVIVTDTSAPDARAGENVHA
jgi:hypothetical protein